MTELDSDDDDDDGDDGDGDDVDNYHNENEYEPETAGVGQEQEHEVAGVDQESAVAGVDQESAIAGGKNENELDEEPAAVEEEGISEETVTEETAQDEQSHQRGYQVAPSRHGNGLKMNLRSQQRKEYDVFNMNGEHDTTELIMLNMSNSDGDLKINEEPFDRLEAEWVFLTETLNWKAGLDENDSERTLDKDKVTLLAEYLFVTEQMGWRKGLKLFGEKGESSIMSELKQIYDKEGFQPKHWYEMTKEERAAALKYLMYLKEKRD